MQNRDKSNKKLVELLWIEINRAIISSSNVKATFANLKKLNLLDAVKEYNLVLDIRKLIELTSMETNDKNFHKDIENEIYPENFGFDENSDSLELKDETKSPQASNTNEDLRNNRQYIDGNPMSENQIRFQEYLAQQFDDKTWLKKVRICL